MKRKQIYLTDSIDADLKGLARARGKTESELIREALHIYLEREKQGPDPWDKLIGLVLDGRHDESIRVDEIVYGEPQERKA